MEDKRKIPIFAAKYPSYAKYLGQLLESNLERLIPLG